MLNERSIEIPWCFARLRGKILDIGSSDAEYLTHLPVGSYMLDQRPLTIPQPKNTIFVHADVRSIPLDSAMFDTVLCLSTYEHFGMAHDPYGTITELGVAEQGMQEMWRVLKPGGRLIMTLPFGKARAYGWLRQWDSTTLKEEFQAYWDCLVEFQCFKLQLSPTKEYVVTEPEDCTDDYDLVHCRANAIVCLVFVKKG